MKADKFVTLMRTIIAEEVRRVVREELRLSLNEQQHMYANQAPAEQYAAGSIAAKYKNILDEEVVPTRAVKVPTVPGKKQAGATAFNSLLQETAAAMANDPGAASFYEMV